MKIFMPFRITPIRDSQAALRRIASIHKEIPPIAPDGIFGTETTESVFAFQKEFMHLHEGVIDYHTWLHMTEELANTDFVYSKAEPLNSFTNLNRPLTVGDTGSDVFLLQIILARLSEKYLNFRPVSVTGVYDDSTRNVVAAYQKITGFAPTGETDKATWDSLCRLSSTTGS